MQNFETIRQPLLGELAMSRKKERRRQVGAELCQAQVKQG
jgi:hypothetical protein